MTKREIRGLVGWTVEEPPSASSFARAARTLVGTVDAVLSFGATAGVSAGPTWALPADPDAYVDIGSVLVRGGAPWLPAVAARRQRLQATQRAVFVVVPAAGRAPVQVPVHELRIVEARPRRGRRQVRHADAPWVLRLTGAGDVEVHAAWLALAWIGHVAGWPEPAQ